MKQNRHYLNALCHCCGRKAQAASAQSFTLWQQATIELTSPLLSPSLASTINCSLASEALLEVTHQDYSIGITVLLLVRATYIWVLFFTQIPFVVNRACTAMPTEMLQHHFGSYHACEQKVWPILQVLQTPGLGPEHINEKNLFFQNFDCFLVLSTTSFWGTCYSHILKLSSWRLRNVSCIVLYCF